VHKTGLFALKRMKIFSFNVKKEKFVPDENGELIFQVIVFGKPVIFHVENLLWTTKATMTSGREKR
jgi:hypothetical protein